MSQAISARTARSHDPDRGSRYSKTANNANAIGWISTEPRCPIGSTARMVRLQRNSWATSLVKLVSTWAPRDNKGRNGYLPAKRHALCRSHDPRQDGAQMARSRRFSQPSSRRDREGLPKSTAAPCRAPGAHHHAGEKLIVGQPSPIGMTRIRDPSSPSIKTRHQAGPRAFTTLADEVA